jgi:hypothetical protein
MAKLRQLVRFPWAADSCPWVGKLRTVLPLKNRDVCNEWIGKQPKELPPDQTMSRGVQILNEWVSERETVVELPFAADCCPCVEQLRTVLPLTVGYQRRCGAVGVHLR